MDFIQKIYALGGQVFEVGGSIRDELLGHPQKDRDLLVLKIPYPQLKTLLQGLGKVVEAGKSFGVIKFRPRGSSQTFDIALPRLEKSTGPKHQDFDVHFDENLPVESDLKRRDFTINAMAREIRSGDILDPFHGQEDLKHHLLRQVFDECFIEDPLRLLRAIQFAARFELQFEAKTYEAMKRHAASIASISPERITEELGKLFRASKPSQGFHWMKEIGLLKFIFPQLAREIGQKISQNSQENIFEFKMKILDIGASDAELENRGDLEIFFALLLSSFDPGSPNEKSASSWLRDYRITMLGVEPSHVLKLIRYQNFAVTDLKVDSELRRWIRKIGKNLVFKLMDLSLAEAKAQGDSEKIATLICFKKRIREELEKNPPLEISDLAIDGNDLIQLGYSEGPAIGKTLQQLLELVLNDPQKNTRSILLESIQH